MILMLCEKTSNRSIRRVFVTDDAGTSGVFIGDWKERTLRFSQGHDYVVGDGIRESFQWKVVARKTNVSHDEINDLLFDNPR